MKLAEGPRVNWRGRSATTETTALALRTNTQRTLNEAVEVQEKLVGDNNLRPIVFLEAGLLVARSVALVDVPNVGLGSGFLIGSSLFVTNNHVIPSPDAAAGAVARFNYQIGITGDVLPTVDYALDAQAFFVTDEALDFTVIGVSQDASARFGIIPILNTSPQVGDKVNIIQHPAGQPKQMAIVDNDVQFVDGQVLQYLTDTMPGSSGSPVFDDQWRLVGIHHSGGWIPEPSNGSTHFRNEGILLSAIVARLRALGLA